MQIKWGKITVKPQSKTFQMMVSFKQLINLFVKVIESHMNVKVNFRS